MLKIAGIVFCVAGSAGYGWLKVNGWKTSLHEIKTWMVLFQKIKSCLLYQKETLESGCLRIGEKETSKQGSVLAKIGKRAGEERQIEFLVIWREEMELWCKEVALPERIQQILLRFPEYMQEADEQLQMNLFSVYMEELHREEVLLEQQIKEQQKPVMAVSLVAGMMLSILLV